jgi:hypothetical protein
LISLQFSMPAFSRCIGIDYSGAEMRTAWSPPGLTHGRLQGLMERSARLAAEPNRACQVWRVNQALGGNARRSFLAGTK